jgi:hypothetical protein
MRALHTWPSWLRKVSSTLSRGLRAGRLRLLVAAEFQAGGADIFPAVAGVDGCAPLAR